MAITVEVNAGTGNTVVRNLTAQEQADKAAVAAQFDTDRTALQQRQTKRAAARQRLLDAAAAGNQVADGIVKALGYDES